MHEEMMPTPAAAAVLGISRRSATEWIKKGILRAYRDAVSGRLYVLKADVERLRPERRLVELAQVGRVKSSG